MRLLLLVVNAILGTWLAGISAFFLWYIKAGHVIGEPNTTIATIEFYLAIVITLWFLWQIPYWVIKGRKEVSNATRSSEKNS